VTSSVHDARPADREDLPAWQVFARRWWVQVVLVYLAARAVSTVLLLVLASVQGANPWTGPSPDYFSFATIWDGRWYEIVAGWGYPATLPIDADGHVGQNAWAFMPGYPYVVVGVMFLTRLPWSLAAVVVAFGFGLAAAIMVYRLLRLRLSHSTSLFAVVLFCVAPTAPLMQLAYAESMYLFLLASALYLLLTRRYWWMLPVVTIMAFVRPSGLAFALAMVLHVVYRWVMRRRRAFPLRDRVASVVVTVVSGLSGLAWPAIAAAVTGSLTAYTDTELNWRAGYIGWGHLVPFAPWLQGASWWFHDLLGMPSWVGYLALTALVALFALVLFTPAVRALGVDLRFWLAAYAVYLLAVFFPQSSTFRLLMPLFPLLGAIAVPKNRWYRGAMVVLFLALQWGWLLVCWGVDGSDWSPP
jgi:hypothetical protein